MVRGRVPAVLDVAHPLPAVSSHTAMARTQDHQIKMMMVMVMVMMMMMMMMMMMGMNTRHSPRPGQPTD
jgi:ABC-type Na+ efflux pump permease subunit